MENLRGRICVTFSHFLNLTNKFPLQKKKILPIMFGGTFSNQMRTSLTGWTITFVINMPKNSNPQFWAGIPFFRFFRANNTKFDINLIASSGEKFPTVPIQSAVPVIWYLHSQSLPSAVLFFVEPFSISLHHFIGRLEFLQSWPRG